MSNLYPITLLSAATTLGPGEAFQLPAPASTFTILCSGTATNGSVVLEGSIDGVTWSQIGAQSYQGGYFHFTSGPWLWVRGRTNSTPDGNATALLAFA